MIRLDDVSKRHGSQILFVDAKLALFRGDKVGLVGPNGSGKSTIFRLMTRDEQPDAGQVVVERNVVIGYFGQDVGEMKGQSVVAETLDGAGPVAKVAARLRELEGLLADPEQADRMDKLIEEFGDVQAQFEQLGGYALDARAREILAGLGFAQDVMDRDVGTLSGGWKMRVALARILLMNPDVMLLDEPTNHLDIESIVWLESFLQTFEGALILTSHDRGWLFHSRITIWKSPVTEMQRTKAHGLLYKTLCKDSSSSRVGAADYLLVFRKRGENPNPITHNNDDLPLDLWQELASPVWWTVNQTRVLNARIARGDKDERHICPLQLDVIDRALALWSNPGDMVFSPFTGIGSEGYCALKKGRRFVGAELKESYWQTACANLCKSEEEQHSLFENCEAAA